MRPLGLSDEEYFHRRREQRAASYWARQSLVATYKMVRGCADCGEDDPVVLDFDHVRGEKLFHVAERSRCELGRLLEEMDKCDVVCANCHRRRTDSRRRDR